MRKIINLILISLAAFFIVINVFGAKLLAGILSSQIGAPVSISRLNVGFTGMGIYGFKLRNPEGFGFQEKNAAVIPEISAKYELGSFFKGKPHISLIVLNFGDVTVEKAAGNKVNLLEVGAVKGMMKGQQGKTAEPSKTEPSKPARTSAPVALQIDEVRVNIGKARYVDSAVQPATVKEMDLGIHDELFKNVTNSADLTKDILFLVMRKVGMASLPGNLDVLAQGVGGAVQSTIDDLKGKFKF